MIRINVSSVLIVLLLLGCQNLGCQCQSTHDRRFVNVVLTSKESLVRTFPLWEDFWQTACYAPGSHFAIWVDGVERTQICIPPRWGSRVLRQKKRFQQEAKKAILDGGNLCPVNSRTQDGTIALVSAGHTTELLSSDSPCHLFVLCDRSWSSSASCPYSRLPDLFRQWAESCAPAIGSSFGIVVPGTNRGSTVKAFYVRTRAPSAARRVSEALLYEKDLVSAVKNAVPEGHRVRTLRVPGSAIVEALGVIGEIIGSSRGDKTIVVLSDMRQVSHKHPAGIWNFEREIPAVEDFVTWMKRYHVVRGLDDVTVHVCGLHHKNGKYKFTSTMAAQLLKVWRGAFMSMRVKRLYMPSSECWSPFSVGEKRWQQAARQHAVRQRLPSRPVVRTGAAVGRLR